MITLANVVRVQLWNFEDETMSRAAAFITDWSRDRMHAMGRDVSVTT